MKAKKKKRSPKESTIVRAILDELRLRGRAVWFRKNHGGPFGSSGVPDIEVVFRPDPVDNATKAAAGWVRHSCEVGGYYRRPEGWTNPAPAIVAFLEVKKPGEKPTELQTATMRAISDAGAHVRVVFSKTEAIEFLEGLGLPQRI